MRLLRFIMEILMSLSRAFQVQLDRLASLVTSDRANEAATVAKAVAEQAAADHAEVIQAHADAEAAIAERDEQIAALQAQLDALSQPVPVGDESTPAPEVVDSVSGGAAPDVVAADPVVDPAAPAAPEAPAS